MGREIAIERGKRTVAGAQSVFARWAGDVGRRGLERGEHDRGEVQLVSVLDPPPNRWTAIAS